jgi:3-dehydroquinate synthase
VTFSTCRALPYPIHIGHGALQSLQSLVPETQRAHRVVVITDDVVGPLYADRVAAAFDGDRCMLISIPPGEDQKTRETWAQISDAMLSAQFGRDCLVVALGGGVICDLAGFVASTFLRGVPVLHLPTTLLAMVDASIGGKTGVDTAHGKNLVGAFHPPIAVVADLDTLHTLSDAERVNGMAEALKHGVIADSDYFKMVARTDVHDADWHSIVAGSVAIKARVVADDEREQGLRKTLNFGHTIGHAIEHLLAFAVPHGACVAFGMLAETRMAVAMGLCDSALIGQLHSALSEFDLPTSMPASLSAFDVVAATVHDKKARAGVVEYALPAQCGAMAGADRGYGIPVTNDTAMAALLAE